MRASVALAVGLVWALACAGLDEPAHAPDDDEQPPMEDDDPPPPADDPAHECHRTDEAVVVITGAPDGDRTTHVLPPDAGCDELAKARGTREGAVGEPLDLEHAARVGGRDPHGARSTPIPTSELMMNVLGFDAVSKERAALLRQRDRAARE